MNLGSFWYCPLGSFETYSNFSKNADLLITPNALSREELEQMKTGSSLIGTVNPFNNQAWLLNGLTVPMRELPVFICSNSSLDKAFGVINKSAFFEKLL